MAGDQAVYVRDPAGGDVRAVKGLRPSYDQVLVNLGGVVVLSASTEKSGPGRARLGTLDGARFAPTFEHAGDELAGSTWWSPYENGLFVSRGLAGGITTWSLGSGPDEVPEPVAVPADVEVTDVVWESPDALLVQAAEGEHTWWLRCAGDTGRCERAADLGASDSVILPTR